MAQEAEPTSQENVAQSTNLGLKAARDVERQADGHDEEDGLPDGVVLICWCFQNFK